MAISTPSGLIPTTDAAVRVGYIEDGKPVLNLNALMYDSFPFFFSQLRDDKGDALVVEEFHEEWGAYMQQEALLVLMAPRDHGKSVECRAYLLWKAWRHNRDRDTGLLLDTPAGQFEAVLFSETLPQAGQWFEAFQSLIIANSRFFADLLPNFGGRSRAALRDVWSRRRVRLRNGFELSIRAFRTSTRGLHPDLIVLDDVLSERNSLTAYQRGKVWTYFVGTLMPMNAKQVILIGTTQHYDDLLHRLRPKKKAPDLIIGNRRTRFRWLHYRAVDWDTGQVLWPSRHGVEDLRARREQDPLLFSREFQNEPRDDASSMFPWTLTGKAVTAGADMTFVAEYVKRPGELVVLGMDLAASEEVGADYTVIGAAAYDRATQKRRLLYAARERGMSFRAQLDLLRTVCKALGVDLGIVEENGFQKWLFTESQKYPETAGRLIGHRTGREKTNLTEGVPAIKLALLNDLWVIPSGDKPSSEFATIWQSEMAAMGWKDGKLMGVAEHDDTVMMFWFMERAVRLVDEWIGRGHDEEVVYGKDVGLDDGGYKISGDY
jgi:hypothetical protein